MKSRYNKSSPRINFQSNNLQCQGFLHLSETLFKGLETLYLADLRGEVGVELPVSVVLPPLDDVLGDLRPTVKVRLVPVEGAAGSGKLLEPRLLGLSGTIYSGTV